MSGPVRASDEILPAGAASGAGRTPVGRSAFFCPLCGVETIQRWDGRPAICQECIDKAQGNILRLPESSREHIRNALTLLRVTATKLGPELVGFSVADVEAIAARLRAALGEK